jgi:hypothetical protein
VLIFEQPLLQFVNTALSTTSFTFLLRIFAVNKVPLILLDFAIIGRQSQHDRAMHYPPGVRVDRRVLVREVGLAKLGHVKVEKHYLDQAAVLAEHVSVVLLFDVYFNFLENFEHFK